MSSELYTPFIVYAIVLHIQQCLFSTIKDACFYFRAVCKLQSQTCILVSSLFTLFVFVLILSLIASYYISQQYSSIFTGDHCSLSFLLHVWRGCFENYCFCYMKSLLLTIENNGLYLICAGGWLTRRSIENGHWFEVTLSPTSSYLHLAPINSPNFHLVHNYIAIFVTYKRMKHSFLLPKCYEFIIVHNVVEHYSSVYWLWEYSFCKYDRFL